MILGALAAFAKNDCPPAVWESLFKTARLVPVVEDAQLVGWSVSEIQPGGPWDKLGLKSKDLIVKIDGILPKDENSFLVRLEGFCTKGFTLTLKRQGSSVTIKRP